MGEGEIHEWNEASESFISFAKIKYRAVIEWLELLDCKFSKPE